MTTSPLDAESVPARVNAALAAFLDDCAPPLAAISPDLVPVTDALADLLSGGKRLRPVFCWWAWRAAGGTDQPAAIRAAASLELVQACALIHDDLMDGSDSRRGMPTVHRRFAALHRAAGWRGAPQTLGTGAAILLGDLCLAWADELLFASGLPAQALLLAKPVYDAMRTELMAGQYLDLVEQARASSDVERSLRVARYKSAKYTIERPLHLGALLAGADHRLLEAFSAYGLPLGEAFQVRDDVLGVFGDPAQTGKPAGDDLREGKRTVLVARALATAPPAKAAELESVLGSPELDAAGVRRAREIIESSGALDFAEQLIADRTSAAIEALASSPMDNDAASQLRRLAIAATARRG